MRLFTWRLAFVFGEAVGGQTRAGAKARSAEARIVKLDWRWHPAVQRTAILASRSDIVYLARSERTDMNELANSADFTMTGMHSLSRNRAAAPEIRMM